MSMPLVAGTDPASISSTCNSSMYRQLDRDNDEIRLVVLGHGTADDPIKCHLVYSSLNNETLGYEALSYVWGPSEDTTDITLDGECFNATKNLHAALCQLRHADEDRILWIDAICINQADLAERASQVSLMFEIYSKAELVVAWLGEHEGQSRKGMELLAAFQALPDQREMSEWGLARLKTMIDWHSCALTTIIDVLSRPYFSRMWVVQEIAASNNTILQCGDSKVEYLTTVAFCAMVKWACEQFGGGVELSKDATQAQCTMAQVNMAKFEFSQAGPMRMPLPGLIEFTRTMPLLEILSTTYRQKQAKDPRDYFFALYHLLDMPSGMRTSLPIDYTIPVKDLYTNLTYSLIEETQRLDVLAHCYLRTSPGPQHIEGLPSWVLDLSDRAVPTRFQRNIGKYGVDSAEADRPHLISHIGRPLDAEPPLDAGGSLDGFVPTVDVSRQRLTVRGVCISQINAIKDAKVWHQARPGYLFIMETIQQIFWWRECLRTYYKAVLERTVAKVPGQEARLQNMRLQYTQLVEEAFFRLVCTEREETYQRLTKFWNDTIEVGAQGRINLPDGTETSELEAITTSLGKRVFFISTETAQGAPEKAGEEKEGWPLTMGLVSENALQSDFVCLIQGCHVPLVLRKVDNGYIVVGDAMVYSIRVGQHIHSFMPGGAMDPEGVAGDFYTSRMQDFVLV